MGTAPRCAGSFPLGYRPDGRSLSIVEEDADLIRLIFETYERLGSVRLLKNELDRQKLRKPVRRTIAGQAFGGTPFMRGELYAILANPIYIGRIRHRTGTHKGLHEPIIDQSLWDSVQKQLADNRHGDRHVRTAAHPSLLAGKLFDPDGEPMIATHANKGSRRYRYYVSRSLQLGEGGKGNAMRLPAPEIEHIVRQEVAAALRDPSRLVAILASSVQGRLPDRELIDKAATLASATATTLLLSNVILRVDIAADAVRIRIDGKTLAHHLRLTNTDQAEPTTITASVKLTRSGRALRMIMPGGQRSVPKIDDTLVNAIAMAHRWWTGLLADPTLRLEDLARREGVNSSLMTRTLRLAFLDPGIIEQICSGKAPARLSFETLRHPESMPALWADQRAVHGIAIDG